jgi:hypothetical protein
MKVTVTATSGDSIWLGQDFIRASSLKVLIDSSVPLSLGKDYQFDEKRNIIRLTTAAKDLLFLSSSDTLSTSYSLNILYLAVPIRLRKEYSNAMLLEVDTTRSLANQNIYQTPAIESTRSESSLSINNSGGFTRGITVGSNQDVTTQSSFNLTFNGNLDKSLSFQGALSEESSVIQPEGNTQLLRDLDRIFINFDYLNSIRVSLGDMYMSSTIPVYNSASTFFPAPVYANIERKVLGANVAAESNSLFGQVGAATTRGKYYSNYFQGENGFQGPYRMYAPGGERNIIIIAGTEQVYIDGVLQERGEQNDYIIDYSTAEVRFQPRRIITNVSRITIDYQYTDEKYSRSLISSSVGTIVGNGQFGVRGIYLREGDNQDAPRNITLSDEDKRIISSAGNDPNKAYKSGVQFVGRDSSSRAKGIYIRTDTSIGNLQSFYRYAPGDSNALYTVNFSYVGSNNGGYRRVSSNQYSFVGDRSGDYDTVTFLPLPSITQLVGGQFATKILDSSLVVTTEYTRSIYEVNRFAPELISQGNSYIIGLDYGNYSKRGNAAVTISAKERFQDSLFKSLDRVRPTESLRTYGVEDTVHYSSLQLSQERERSTNLNLHYNNISISGGYGSYTNYSTQYKGENISTSIAIAEDSAYIPTIHASYSRIPTTLHNGSISSLWDIISGSVSKRFGTSLSISPFIGFNNTKKESLIGNSLSVGSFILRNINGGFLFADPGSISGKLEATYYSEDSLRSSVYSTISDNYKYQLQLSGSFSKEFSLTASLSVLEKRYQDSLAKVTSRGDFTNYYASIAPRYRTLNNAINTDARIDIFSELSSRTEKVFILTQPGYGSYRYLGDLNANNLQDPSEFEVARYSDQANYVLISRPTEVLFPTTTNNLAFRFKISPSYLSLPSGIDFLHYISSETSMKIERKSLSNASLTDYFTWNTIFNDTSTVSANIFIQEDLYLFESDVTKQLRFRFIERKGLNQYDLGTEDNYHRTLAVRALYSLTRELKTEINVDLSTDIVNSSSLSLAKNVNTTKFKTTIDLTYTPFFSPLSSVSNVQYSIGKDRSDPSASVTIYSISERVLYSLTSDIRMGVLLGLDKLVIPPGSNYFAVPYSLTEGRDDGLTTRWELTIDYNIGSGLTASATYSGRHIAPTATSTNTIHSGRAEIRATF